MREATHPRCVWDNFPNASAESRLLNYLYNQIKVIPLKGRGNSQSPLSVRPCPLPPCAVHARLGWGQLHPGAREPGPGLPRPHLESVCVEVNQPPVPSWAVLLGEQQTFKVISEDVCFYNIRIESVLCRI